jgi:hypothetical protein
MATERLEKKEMQIEEIKNQCEAVTSKIREDWKKAFDEKVVENFKIKVLKLKK